LQNKSKKDHNEHIRAFLKYYIELKEPPKYAVLLNGAWGIGKTFFIKEFMKQFEDKNPPNCWDFIETFFPKRLQKQSIEKNIKYAYVSLYGLSSHDEIDYSIALAILKNLKSSFFKYFFQFFSFFIKGILKYFRIDGIFRAKYFIDTHKPELIIFDDIERCNIPINNVLGYINKFVEHDDLKVILIANEAEITLKDESYKRIREKLIGKTFELQSSLEQAFEIFINNIQDEKLKAFLKSKSEIIITIYHQSESHNLRILRQLMKDFERFYQVLENKFRENNGAMTELTGLLFSLSFELKGGRLSEDDLRDREMAQYYNRGLDKDKHMIKPIVASAERYLGINIYTTTLSDETLINILIKSVLDKEKICDELDKSTYFVTVADEPAWRTVWHYNSRTDDETSSALKEMERAFVDREYTVTGEILHVLGLQLHFAKNRVISRTQSEIVAEGKRYIDDLYSHGKLEACQKNDYLSDSRHGLYGGLAMAERETSEYKELDKYLNEKSHASYEMRYPDIATELLSDMKTDTDLFRSKITNLGEGNFYYVPVLASLDPNTFVSELLNQHPEKQLHILDSLRYRYQHEHLMEKLAAEDKWAKEVRACIYEQTENILPIAKFRVRQILEWTLDKILKLGEHSPKISDENA
jgi:hypothetical protein